MSVRDARWIVGALAVAVLHACQPPPPRVSLAHGDRSYTSNDYDRVLERWTRQVDLVEFQALEERFRADATFQSWDFRWALAVRQSSDRVLPPNEREALLRVARESAEQEHEFFVALLSEYVRWSELTRRFTAWEVRLVDDRGREVSPTRIEPVRRPGAAERTYFPYITPWRNSFRIHFPRRVTTPDGETEVLGPGTRWFVLRFRGPRGHADLRWDLE